MVDPNGWEKMDREGQANFDQSLYASSPIEQLLMMLAQTGVQTLGNRLQPPKEKQQPLKKQKGIYELLQELANQQTGRSGIFNL